MKAPDKIYLQVCGTCPLEGVECERCNFDGLEEVTWSTDKVFDKDVEFIRKEAVLALVDKLYDEAPSYDDSRVYLGRAYELIKSL